MNWVPSPTSNDNDGSLLDETKVETTSHMKPELKSRVDNFSDYDVIFVGYPLWWYDMPMAIYSFLNGYDFSGKTIVLFTTHGGNRFFHRANTKNMAMIQGFVDGDETVIKQVNQRAWQSAIVLIVLLLLIALMIWALVSFGSYLYSLVASVF